MAPAMAVASRGQRVGLPALGRMTREISANLLSFGGLEMGELVI